MKPDAAAQRGYRWCRALARSHYENFPVASWLLPRGMRDPVAAVYAFARTADDIADEGDAEAAQRLRDLDAMQSALDASVAGDPPDEPLYQALADSFRRHALPAAPLYDLLSAFRQDVTTRRYTSYDEVMDYCGRSACPVGRLLLQLAGEASPATLVLSDRVCSALQWINFLQDIGQDCHENDRIYLPLEELDRFGVSEADIRQQRNSPQMRELFRFQLQRTAELLASGRDLGNLLPGRFGLEIRAVCAAGARVIDRLSAQGDVFSRPRLSRLDKAGITWAALRRVAS